MKENEGREIPETNWSDVDADEQDYLQMLLGNASYHYFALDETKKQNGEIEKI